MSSPAADAVFWASVALCVVAQLGILRSVLAPRAVPAPRPGVPAPRRAVELLWAVIPALALAALLLLTWRAMHSPRTKAASAVLVDGGGDSAGEGR